MKIFCYLNYFLENIGLCVTTYKCFLEIYNIFKTVT